MSQQPHQNDPNKQNNQKLPVENPETAPNESNQQQQEEENPQQMLNETKIIASNVDINIASNVDINMGNNFTQKLDIEQFIYPKTIKQNLFSVNHSPNQTPNPQNKKIREPKRKNKNKMKKLGDMNIKWEAKNTTNPDNSKLFGNKVALPPNYKVQGNFWEAPNQPISVNPFGKKPTFQIHLGTNKLSKYNPFQNPFKTYKQDQVVGKNNFVEMGKKELLQVANNNREFVYMKMNEYKSDWTEHYRKQWEHQFKFGATPYKKDDEEYFKKVLEGKWIGAVSSCYDFRELEPWQLMCLILGQMTNRMNILECMVEDYDMITPIGCSFKKPFNTKYLIDTLHTCMPQHPLFRMSDKRRKNFSGRITQQKQRTSRIKQYTDTLDNSDIKTLDRLLDSYLDNILQHQDFAIAMLLSGIFTKDIKKRFIKQLESAKAQLGEAIIKFNQDKNSGKLKQSEFVKALNELVKDKDKALNNTNKNITDQAKRDFDEERKELNQFEEYNF